MPKKAKKQPSPQSYKSVPSKSRTTVQVRVNYRGRGKPSKHFMLHIPRGARVTGFASDICDAVDERRQKVGVPQVSRER